MLFLCKFAESNDVLVDADSPDDAIASLVRHEVTDTPVRLVALPRGVLALEVRWPEPPPAYGAPLARDNPANFSEVGICLEPLDATADWLEAEDAGPDLAPVSPSDLAADAHGNPLGTEYDADGNAL